MTRKSSVSENDVYIFFHHLIINIHFLSQAKKRLDTVFSSCYISFGRMRHVFAGGYVMLNFSIMPLNSEHIDEYCLDIEKQIKTGVCIMPLFSMSLVPEGIPATDKADIFCKLYEKYKEKLDAKGLPSGVLMQSTMGHGWLLNAQPSYQRIIRLKDGASPESFCPLDEGFKAYVRCAAKRIAKSRPNHIMLDDDFVLMRQGSCACPLHMAKFNELAKESLTREELYASILKNDEEGMRRRAIFEKTQLDSLIECAKEIRAGIDEIDETIPASYCLTGNCAEAAYEIGEALAGKGNPVTVRVNNGGYCPKDNRDFARIMYNAANQINVMTKRPDVLLAESDTCPQNRYSTSAARLHAHYTFSLLEGMAGAKHWITRLHNYEPKSGAAYRKKLGENLGFYEKISALAPTLTWLGCKIPVNNRPVYTLTPRDEAMKSLGWYTSVLDRFGLPMHFANKDEGVWFFDGGCIQSFTDEEILKCLSEKCVFDADAAEHVISRGYGKYLGVDVKKRAIDAKRASSEALDINAASSTTMGIQPSLRELIPLSDKIKRLSEVYHLRDSKYRDILFPGVTSFENELGGTAVVFSGSSTFEYKYYVSFGFLNETRKRQLINILEDFGALPVYYPGDEELLLKAARTEDGGLFTIALNLSLDEIEEARLVINRDVTSIKRITSDGSYKNVEFKRQENEYSLDLTAKTFEPLALIIE